MARAEEEFGVTFTVNWHPYFLDVTLESKGLTKRDNYRGKGMSDNALDRMEKSMAENFAGEDIVRTQAVPTTAFGFRGYL